MSVQRMKTFWLKYWSFEFKEPKEEEKYGIERAKNAAKQAMRQNFTFMCAVPFAIIFGAFISIFGYFPKFQSYTQLEIVISQLFWIPLYLLSKILKKWSTHFTKPKYKYYLYIGVTILFHIIALFAFDKMEGPSKLVIEGIYLLHSNMYSSKILKCCLLQVIISLPFYTWHIYQIILYVQNYPADFILIEIAIILVIGGLIYSYREEVEFRKLFSMKRLLLSEKQELSKFLKMTPFAIFQYNLQTHLVLLNAKGKKLISALKLEDFEQMGSMIHLKEDKKQSLFNFIEEKISYFKRRANNNSTHSRSKNEYIRISNDFSFTLSNRKYSTMLLKVPKTLELEINFYWKEADENRVTIIIEKKGTKAKLREEKISKKLRNVMFRAMSHNLKTPLNGVLSFMEELIERDKSEEVKSMWMNSHFLESKIEDIQDFMCIEEGIFHVKEKMMSLKKLFRELRELCELQAELDEVELNFKIMQPIPEKIFGDYERLRRILLHLIQNGIKYSSKNSTVTIIVKPFLTPENLQFSVHNYGSTIEPDSAKSIFHFMNSQDNNNLVLHSKEDLTTTSFSLPITQKIATSIGSTLHIKSNNDEGTKFYFYLENHPDLQLRTRETPTKEIQTTIQDPDSLLLGYLTKSPLQLVKKKTRVIKSQTYTANWPPARKKEISSKDLDFWIKRDGSLSGVSIDSSLNLEDLEFDKKSSSEVINESLIDSLSAFSPRHIKSYFSPRVVNVKKTLTCGSLVAPSRELREKPLPLSSFSNPSHRITVSCADVQIPKHAPLNIVHSLHPTPNIRILSVEDNGVNRLAIKRLLEKRGFIVDEAFNGQEAVKIIKHAIKKKQTNLFSVIFMDLNMPVMGGLECTEILLNLMKEKKINKIPIFALTAHDSEQMAEKCNEIGFNEFISKPIKADKLDQVLQKYNLFIHAIE